jgi:O-antigen/teichoic acid export membrane protein
MTFSDGIIARHSLSATDAGLYNAAALSGRALMAILSFMPAVILAKLPHRAAGEPEFGIRAFIVAGAICLGAVCFFALFPVQILSAVGGAAYRTGAPLVAVYGIAAAALAMANIIAIYRIGKGVLRLGFALVAAAACEIGTMLLVAPSAVNLVSVVVAGHVGALLLSLGMRPSRGGRSLPEVAVPGNAE